MIVEVTNPPSESEESVPSHVHQNKLTATKGIAICLRNLSSKTIYFFLSSSQEIPPPVFEISGGCLVGRRPPILPPLSDFFGFKLVTMIAAMYVTLFTSLKVTSHSFFLFSFF